MRRQDKRRLKTIVLVLFLAGGSYFAKKMGWINENGDFVSQRPVEGSSERSGQFDVLKNCTLSDHRNNDGDSFDVLHNGKKHTLRLYFVDAPEKRRHQYNGDRIKEQANYFGINDSAAINTGEAARDFALNALRRRPFDVSTKFEAVFGSERVYAFVDISGSGGSTPKYLSEELVRLGLARIHTKGEDLPNGTRWQKHKDYLKGVESKAKSAKKGAWDR